MTARLKQPFVLKRITYEIRNSFSRRFRSVVFIYPVGNFRKRIINSKNGLKIGCQIDICHHLQELIKLSPRADHAFEIYHADARQTNRRQTLTHSKVLQKTRFFHVSNTFVSYCNIFLHTFSSDGVFGKVKCISQGFGSGS